MSTFNLLSGNSRSVISSLPERSVQLVVTSPPYYRMRRYDAPDMVYGGTGSCEHLWENGSTKRNFGDTSKSADKQRTNGGTSIASEFSNATCSKCGAWRGQLGWEETPDLFIDHLCEVLNECKRVLTDTGVMIVNLGDTFAGSQKGAWIKNGTFVAGGKQATNKGSVGVLPVDLRGTEYKRKDLLTIPFMAAQALRREGWYLRSEIPWIIPNKMPGPWKDRPIIGHEWFFMLTKSEKSSYNGDKVKMQNGRSRRTSDFFFDSLDNSIEFYEDYLSHLKYVRDHGDTLLVDDDSEPLALIVNNRPSSIKHFAMYNENLVRPLIEACTEEGDTVLDPFSGTATTGRCALSMDRNYIGIDVSKSYSDIARGLLDQIVNRPVQMTMDIM